MFLINGIKQNYISASDRAIHFGDGIFTTAHIINGHICLYDAHLKRLQKACAKIFIEFTQWDILQHEIQILSKNINNGVLKIIISRGIGSMGYSTKNCLQPSRILSILPYPQHYNKWRNTGINLALSPIRLSYNPLLTGVKHLNRLEQVLINIHLNKSNADEFLLLDDKGIITECCTANLFWRKGYKIFTPALNRAGINGVMRQFCISKLINSQFSIIEVMEKPEALKFVDEVVVCNALMPILPVCSYEHKSWKSRKLYQFLTQLYEQNINNE